jgi:pimeloyl-ACP methyl ester carboxylesterase
MAGVLRWLHRLWVWTGACVFVVFTAWCLLAYRANADGRQAAVSGGNVLVSHRQGYWQFLPHDQATPPERTGLLFFAGALVDARAYARLARRAAEAGYPAVVIELPRRGAFAGADGAPVLERGMAARGELRQVHCWVVGGHSRGGEVAARFALQHARPGDALLLIGTSHPRDVSLRAMSLPVTKLIGTRDGLASPQRNERNRHNLPAATRWISIDGANHSQFGDYGFQPGDRMARLPREAQHKVVAAETLAWLRQLAASQASAAATPLAL